MRGNGAGWGHYWYCRGDPREVLRFLLSGAGLPFTASPSTSTPSAVIFETRSSFLKWGEIAEVTVTSVGGGCTVTFRGVNGHPINPTAADPKGVASRVATALGQYFGPLTPSG